MVAGRVDVRFTPHNHGPGAVPDSAVRIRWSQPLADRQTLPLEPARTLEFVTDEGTWLSLDVTPDGRRIVFELLGDLYTMPIEGGAAKDLTPGKFDVPTFSLGGPDDYAISPDGKTLTLLSQDFDDTVAAQARLHQHPAVELVAHLADDGRLRAVAGRLHG